MISSNRFYRSRIRRVAFGAVAAFTTVFSFTFTLAIADDQPRESVQLAEITGSKQDTTTRELDSAAGSCTAVSEDSRTEPIHSIPTTDVSSHLAALRRCDVNVNDLLFSYHRRSESVATEVIVDVRRRADYDKAHIPGAIHIPLYAVKAKVYLKGMTVFLVGDGHQDSTVGNECNALRNAGFARVGVLRGGMNAWYDAQGPLEGEDPSRALFNRLSPTEFVAQLPLRYWLPVIVKDRQTLIPSNLKDAVVLESNAGEKEIVQALSGVRATKKWAQYEPALVFMTERGADYERLEPIVAAHKWINVFFLQGGLQAYRAEIERHTPMLAHRHTTEKGSRKCGAT